MGAEGLDFQMVSVDFTGGLDTRTNQKLRVPGKWDLLTNCTHSKDGSLSKRDGVRALVADANGHGLATFDDELLSINGTTVSTTIANPSLHSSAVSGQLACLHLDKKEVRRTSDDHDSIDCAVGNGLECYVWRRLVPVAGVMQYAIEFCVIDSTTRAYLFRPTHLETASALPRVVFVGDAFMFLWRHTATGDLHAAVCDLTVGIGPITNLGIAIGAMALDAVAFGFDAVTNFVDTAAVSYVYADGATSVRCSQVTYNPVTRVPVVMATTNLITEAQLSNANICGLAIALVGGAPFATNYACTFVASIPGAKTMAGFAANAIDDAWALASAATRIDAAPPISPPLVTAQPTHVVATRYPVSAATAICQAFVDGFCDAGGIGGTGVRAIMSYSVRINGAGFVLTVLSSRAVLNSNTTTATLAPQGPFICGYPMIIKNPVGGSFDAPETLALPVCLWENIIQSGVFVVDAYTGAVIGKALYGQAGWRIDNSSSPSTPRRTSTPRTARTGLATHLLPVQELGRLEALDGVDTTKRGVAALVVTPNIPLPSSAAGAWAPRKTQIGRSTMIANGSLSAYDGLSVTEAGFDLFPEGIVITTNAGAGTWAAGTYEFVAIYEHVDAQGQRHQSAPSPPVQVMVALNDSVTVRVPTLQLTQRSGVRHVVFCTQPNGTTFNRTSNLTTALGLDVINSKAIAESSTTFPANPPASNELLYSQPFVADTTLPNDGPGPCSKLAAHQGRLWMSLDDSPGAYRYSQALVEGVGLQFNETLGGVLPVDAGRIVGFASMDEMLVILTERKLYRITGSGPTVSGGYNGYSDPVEIPSDVGCNSVASVLPTPEGVMFRSEKGWYVLSRDLQVKYVGGPIKRWDSDLVSSVVMLRDRQEIRVSSSGTFDTAFAGALQFCHSYVSDTWSVFQVTSLTTTPIPFSNGLMVFDAVWWQGRYVTISYYDGINEDLNGVYLDQPGANINAFPIGMSARSSFLHLSALEGYQRVRWLYLTASAPAAPATSLSFRIDFDDLYQVRNPPGAPGCYLTSGLTLTALPFANPASIDLRHKFRRQKCKSVAITVNENPIAAGSAGLTGFQALALQIGVRRGTNKLPAAQAVP